MTLEREATLTVNGRAQPYQARTISDYLSGVGIDPAHPGVAVAVNASIVRRAEWATTLLQPGDQVEIVQARAGG
jgi:thiamine biosynthesis protein ThiS